MFINDSSFSMIKIKQTHCSWSEIVWSVKVHSNWNRIWKGLYLKGLYYLVIYLYCDLICVRITIHITESNYIKKYHLNAVRWVEFSLTNQRQQLKGKQWCNANGQYGRVCIWFNYKLYLMAFDGNQTYLESESIYSTLRHY